LLALAAIPLALALTLASGREQTTEARGAVAAAALDRARQDGFLLGATEAPVRVTVFADLTSLQFQDFLLVTAPVLVEREVLPGRAQILLRTVARSPGSGPSAGDSLTLARLAQAAGLQDRLWHFSTVAAANYVGRLEEWQRVDLLRAVPGLDWRRAEREASGRRAIRAVRRATGLARKAGFRRGVFIRVQARGTRHAERFGKLPATEQLSAAIGRLRPRAAVDVSD